MKNSNVIIPIISLAILLSLSCKNINEENFLTHNSTEPIEVYSIKHSAINNALNIDSIINVELKKIKPVIPVSIELINP